MGSKSRTEREIPRFGNLRQNLEKILGQGSIEIEFRNDYLNLSWFYPDYDRIGIKSYLWGGMDGTRLIWLPLFSANVLPCALICYLHRVFITVESQNSKQWILNYLTMLNN